METSTEECLTTTNTHIIPGETMYLDIKMNPIYHESHMSDNNHAMILDIFPYDKITVEDMYQDQDTILSMISRVV